MRDSFIEGEDPLAYLRTLHQIVDSSGQGYKAYGTHVLWIGSDEHFTPPRTGNTVTSFTTGEEYFKRISGAFSAAKSEIWISGWQINWDVLLVPGERLFDALYAAAKRGVQIYVMPWKGAGAVPTYVKETEVVLSLINDGVKSRRVHFLAAASMADESRVFFSHHQKHVVVDRTISFVGGIDLAYGRRDDAHFGLRADASGRESLDRYNGCIAHILREKPALVLNPFDLNTHNGQHGIIRQRQDFLAKVSDRKYRQASTSFALRTLDPACQPRMPWQDSHVEIVGPAALDVALNFVVRWNSEGGAPTLALPAPASSAPIQGSCTVQVLRSAPASMCKAEFKKFSPKQLVEYFGHVGAKSSREENICQAMMNLIERSQHYIYIENQFFVSAFGEERGVPENTSGPLAFIQSHQSQFDKKKPSLTHVVPGDAKAKIRNNICFAVGERIGKAILTNGHKPFHAFIVLPVHPEGPLNDPGLMLQVHQTMQTLVFGEFSLINQIRRHLNAKELLDKKDPKWRDGYWGDGYQAIDIMECEKYLTLLNLRNWEKIGERYVTEQIYVHNKMMIVDDLFAIVGSANVNERSMLGSRDSELAVLISDNKSEAHDIDGSGKLQTTRNFARDLRKSVWRKIFGLTAGGKRAAESLNFAVDQPANPDAWKEIRKVALKNTNLFEAAFDFIPRDKTVVGGVIKNASIWPNWDRKAVPPNLMPFDDTFWSAAQQNESATSGLSSVKGFITLLPLNWTKGENNSTSFHAALYSATDKRRNPNEQVQTQSPIVTASSELSDGNKG